MLKLKLNTGDTKKMKATNTGIEEKGTTTFPSLEALLKWTGHDKITFPLIGKGWTVILAEGGPIVTSDFYNVKENPERYGAFTIFGHLFPLEKEMVSGLIEVGSDGIILNRRRVVEGDGLDENQTIISVVIAQPDRAIEPIAVIISGSLDDFSSDQTVWINAILKAKDGPELMAIQAVMAKIFC